MVAAAKLIEKVGGKVSLFTGFSHFGQENFLLKKLDPYSIALAQF